ncbi:MAG: PKD domain-containing protein [Bacteroidota bacterium]
MKTCCQLLLFTVKFRSLGFLCLLFIFSFSQVFSQGQWEWVHGSAAGSAPVFGTMGVPNAANTPGGDRYCSTPWVDQNGMFWYWGGENLPAGTMRNDLWTYNPATNEWTWYGGNGISAPPGVFGTMGVASATTWPGGKLHGSPGWIDQNNNLWVYGTESGWANDLWKYNIGTGQWTWMHGSGGTVTAPTYGTINVASPLNTPGGFIEENTDPWVDANNNIWFFNWMDGVMWMFDVSISQWIWKKGTPMGPPVVGTLGVPAPANTPGAGSSNNSTWCTWQDSNGDFWMLRNCIIMFGPFQTEVWKFDVTLEQWACMKIISPVGMQFTTLCSEDPNNSPGMDSEKRAVWVDDCNNMWRLDGNASFGGEFWRYNPGTNAFALIAQYTGAAVYGTQGTPSTLNHPAITEGQAWWQNQSGFWLRDGMGTSDVLWLYHPDTVVAGFQFTDSCLTVEFTDMSVTGCNNIKSWVWDFGDGNSSSLQHPVHTYTSSGAYNVTLIVQNCTWDADTITQSINVNCGVTVSIQPDTICVGDCINLMAATAGGSPPYQYTWNNGITSTTAGPINVCPAVTTTYTVIVTDSLGDTDTSSAIIVVVSPPVVNLGMDTTLCAPGFLLDAQNPGANFIWQDGSNNQFYNVTASGSYWVTVNNSGCSTTDSIDITINNVDVNLGANITACTGSSATLNAQNSGSVFSWNTGSATQTITVAQTGNYWVTVTNGMCTDTDSISVIFYDPFASFTAVPQQGCAPLTVLFTNQSVTPVNSIAQNNWDFGDGGISSVLHPGYTYNNPGTYTVTLQVTTTDGCTDDTTIASLITVFPGPVAGFSFSPLNPDMTNPVVSFTDISSGGILWEWNFGDGTTSTEQHPEHTYAAPGDYTVTLTVTNAQGCTSTITYYLHIGTDFSFYCPNAFTPNGGDLNELFMSKGVGISTFSMQIFNRWGELIFESTDINKGWDGTYMGKEAAIDVYIWKVRLTATDGIPYDFIGHVTLIR